MNIKKRFILSNLLTILIPFAITLFVGFCYIFITSTIFNKSIGYDSFKELTAIRAELLNASNSISLKNIEEAKSPEFQQYLSQRLNEIEGKFIIINNQETAAASEGLSKIDIEKALEVLEIKKLKSTLELDDKSYFLQSSQITMGDGTKTSIILLVPVGGNYKFLKIFVVLLIVVFLLSFITTSLVMSYQFSNKISNPIASLKWAAGEISSGNLQCEIIEAGDEEIKDLCHEFELMRVQLKDSIHLRMRYDDNRNMLVSSISHDLRTPITSIKGYVEGILDGVAYTPEKMESYLKTIYSKTQLVDSMIDDLLLYSKLDLHQLPFNFEKTDIIEYVDFCIGESIPEFERSNISLEVKSSMDGPRYVMLDRDRMRRVVMNILANSQKYMDKTNGDIHVMLRETNSSIIIEFRDNGSGIDKNDVEKIFNRFYRADAARSGTNGSGLGLAIAKQIVEGHRGKIWALSHGTEGTSIIISLGKIVME